MGDPVAGNPTQYMLEKAFAAGRLDWRFLTFEVPALDFEGALRGARIFGFHGIMLAPPHRSTVLPYLEELSEVARLCGQVNCIKQSGGRLYGDNTEGQALRQLVEQTTDLADSQITIVGAGRLARALAAELAQSGAREIVFACRRPETIEAFVQSLSAKTPLDACRCERLSAEPLLKLKPECRLLINATPVGRMQPREQLPVDLDTLSAGLVVADVVYNPPQTWLLRIAQEHGYATIDGLTLLIEQVALAFEIWTGATADRQAMREAIEEFLVL
jgi:shikimate dehydrogenase